VNSLIVGLFYLVAGLAVVALVGHGLWVAIAAIFRGIREDTSRYRPRPASLGQGRQPCVRCGLKLPWEVRDCPRCGLDRDGLNAAELADLEATARQLERFRKRQELPAQDIEALWKALQEQHRRLVGSPELDVPVQPVRPLPAVQSKEVIPEVVPVRPAGPAVPPPRVLEPVQQAVPLPEPPTPVAPDSAEPPWDRLERLLAGLPDLTSLSASERVRALLLFRQCPAERLATLTASCQWMLARLLQQAGRTADSLLTYERLTQHYPHHPELARITLEAAQLAKAVGSGKRAVGSEEGVRGQESGVSEEIPAPSAGEEAASLPAAHCPLPTARRRSLTEMLAGFMEEKNILWGELVGGLLIVGGSIALVISLWNTLQENPYFPFGIFAVVTAALFGAGLYTLHHWKLESTSRGLLIIATLLVPLCFTVLPSMLEEEAADTLELAIAAGGLAVFLALIFQAGRVLVPAAGWLLPLAVLGCAACQLLAARLLGPGGPPAPFRLVMLLACLPVASHAVAIVGLAWRLTRGEALSAAAAWSLLALLGMATYALALALGVLVFRSGDVGLALKHLAPLVSVAAVSILAGGLTLHRGLEGAPDQAGLRTTGTATALAAATLMLVAVALAWPLRWIVLVVCSINFGVLTFVAFRALLPVAHAAALPCLVLGCLLAFHLGEAAFPEDRYWLVEYLLSTRAAARLVLLGVACAGLGELLARLRQPQHALAYSVGAGLIGLVGLGMATWHGLDSPGLAAWTTGVYGAAGLAVNLRWRRAFVSYVGLILVGAATLWALHWGWPGRFPGRAAVLGGEALTTAALALFGLPDWLRPAFRQPLARVGEGIGWLAVIVGILSGLAVSWQPEFVLAGLCLLGLHLTLTALEGRMETAQAAGLMLLGTVTAAAGWAGTAWQVADLAAMLALCLAATSTFMAAVSVVASRVALAPGETSEVLETSEVSGGRSPFRLLAMAWREVTAAAVLLALLLVGFWSALDTNLHTATALSVAATAWLLTWRYRSVALAWLGSVFVLVGVAHWLYWATVMPDAQLAAIALLLHATMVLVASLVLRALPGEGLDRRRLFVVPLGQSALVSTVLALPLILLLDSGPLDIRARCLAWLSAVWLVIAWADVSRWLFAAFQAALCVTVGFAVTAWLEGQEWVFWDARSLQAYGLGLTGLCVVWVVARIVLQRQKTARQLLLPDWPGVDRLVLGAVLLGQMGLADWGIVKGALQELAPRGAASLLETWPESFEHAYGPGAWLLLSALGLVVLVALWQPAPWRRQTEALLGLVVLGVTAPVLWSGGFLGVGATASAFRWGLATAFLAGSALVWLRRPLTAGAAALRIPTGLDPKLPGRVRRGLLDLALVPLLVLSIVAASLVCAGTPPTRPDLSSVFGQVGSLASLLIPLAIATVALVGHAVRERSAGYAFTAGLVVLGMVSGGYAVGTLRGEGQFGVPEWTRLLQLGVITAAAWALVWQVGRHLLAALQQGTEGRLARPLMAVQVGMALAGNACVLLGGIGILTITSLDPTGQADWHQSALAWTQLAGTFPGWLAVAFTAAAVWSWRGRTLSQVWLGTLGFAAVALTACSAEVLFPGWGFRTLLLGCASYGLVWAILPNPEKPATEPASGLRYFSAPYWVAGTAGVVELLGFGSASIQGDQLWAAGAIGLSGTAGILLGVRWRRVDWALMGGLGFNLAASFVLWHLNAGSWLSDWWVPLLQVNAAVCSTMVLVLMALGRRLAQQPLAGRTRWEIAIVYFMLWLASSFVPPITAFVSLYLFPEDPGTIAVLQAGGPLGWLALALGACAAIRHTRRANPTALVHVLGGVGLTATVILAATLSHWDEGSWLAYHSLLAALVAQAGLFLVAGWTASAGKPVGPAFWPAERRETAARFLAGLFPTRPTQRWVEAQGIVLVGLALRGALADPTAPYWPAGVVLAASLLAGALAFWSGRDYYVHISGCLVFLAGVMGWSAWGQGRLDVFLQISIICLGIASTVWSVLEVRLGRRLWTASSSAWSMGTLLGLIVVIALFGPAALAARMMGSHDLDTLAGFALLAALVLVFLANFGPLWARRRQVDEDGDSTGDAQSLPFSQAAGLLGLNLLAVLVGLGLGSDLTVSGAHLAGPLAWVGWVAMFLAGVARLWNVEGIGRGLRTLPLYILGVLGIGLALHELALSPARLSWALTLALAGYVLITMLGARAVPNLGWLWQMLRLPARPAMGLEEWFLLLQAGLTCLLGMLSVWVSFAFEHRADRLVGPLAVAMLVPAWVVGTRLREKGFATRPLALASLRYWTLMLAALALADLAWAIPAPQDVAAWLNRNILLFAALAVAAVFCTLGLRHLLPRQERWAECGERLGPKLSLAAVLVMLVVLGQEMVLYDSVVRAAPTAPWAIALVGLTLIGLAAAGIAFAVRPNLDPLALPERRRPLYVYGAEVVLVLLFLHVRLTMPFLFGGFLARHWMFVVMFLAFLGVGLAELCQRRNLTVLAGPLQQTGVFLPLLPLLAFWLQTAAVTVENTAGEHIRGLQPLLRPVSNLPRDFDRHALLWFLVGLLYLLVAVSRRSFRFALLAALAGNFGMWALLYHYRDYGLTFLVHPQLWLIPLSVIILVSEHLNRDRLPAAQAAGLRYAGLILLYVSSTADLFIAGLGDVGLSLVLAVLAVLGILAGIQFRVRAFLFVGLTFLVLVIFARIWHAAVTQAQTWVWWVCLILLGAAILALFAVFEKRRNEVLKLLEELKKWR
jgi:hypothetical protein